MKGRCLEGALIRACFRVGRRLDCFLHCWIITSQRLVRRNRYTSLLIVMKGYRERDQGTRGIPWWNYEDCTDSILARFPCLETGACLAFLYQVPGVSRDVNGFKRDLLKLWFTGYKRVVHNDSSSFEHAFVGELRDGKVSGFHNWYIIDIADSQGVCWHWKKRRETSIITGISSQKERARSMNRSWVCNYRGLTRSRTSALFWWVWVQSVRLHCIRFVSTWSTSLIGRDWEESKCRSRCIRFMAQRLVVATSIVDKYIFSRLELCLLLLNSHSTIIYCSKCLRISLS